MQRRQSRDPETERRLQVILSGAFAGPPTRLKDIPTRFGDQRQQRRQPRKRRRRAK